jgi:2-dehydro-3-deoxyphosphooctonate aldolase (KDO 8-P synthase)
MSFESLKNIVNLKTSNGNFSWGEKNSWVLFAGPDIFESYSLVRDTALELKKISTELKIPWIFKCSFDKANRQSSKSFRGPGMEEALKGLEKIKGEVGCDLITDIHESSQIERIAKVADVIQIPAFLCRQTDLLQTAAKTGKVLNIKKGQFMAPWDMKSICEKALEVGNKNLLLCERGNSFGYNRLVNDMTGLVEMRKLGYPVIMDATHSVQLPGGQGNSSGGRPEMIEVLARAAMAVGVDGLFLETHPEPEKALCDGPNALRLSEMKRALSEFQKIRQAII